MNGKRKSTPPARKPDPKPAPKPARRKTPARDLAADEALYARARTAWEQGDWPALAGLADTPVDGHGERARLALLTAAGLTQTGDLDDARRHARLALGWGCPRETAAQVLAACASNTLGRAACLIGDRDAARRHFTAALQSLPPGQRSDAAIHAREIRERAQLGLLPEAAEILGETLEAATEDHRISGADAAMLKVQIELLNHTLGIAQRRGQLGPDAASPGGTDGLEARAVSQLGQELWVLEQTGHKRGGFFVEFGATDGILLSNSWLLETEFGWSGICAEPNPAFFEKLKVNRNCTVAPDCIMGRTGDEVEFVLADEYGGVTDYAEGDAHAPRRAAYRNQGRVLRLTTISLDDFLKKYDAPRTIDYLSIDTEGSEYEILSAFPFNDWDIRFLTVEHNFMPVRAEIRALLESHGYRCTEAKWDDWYAREG